MTDLLVDLGLARPLRTRHALDAALREAVRDGRLAQGTRLPSTRALAAELGLARSTVVGAYEQLCAEGDLQSRRGSGTIVGSVGGVAAMQTAAAPRQRPRPSINFMRMVVDALESVRVGAVLVTPAHQYPLGVTLSAERRSALVAWARRTQGWVVEDDDDGEFRYDRQPIGALQGLDPERVIYSGRPASRSRRD